MRILMTSILDMTRDMNGVVVSAKEHQAALRAIGHEVDFATPYNSENGEFAKWMMYRTSRLYKNTGKSGYTFLNLVIKAFMVYSQVRRSLKKFDYFHAHDVVSALAVLLAAGGNKVKLLHVHFHESPWDEFVSGGYVKRNSLVYRLLRWSFRKTIKSDSLNLIHVSNTNLNYVEGLVPGTRDKSIVLYPGLEQEDLFSARLMKERYLINVGSVDSRKNQILLIDILSELEKLGTVMLLLIVGAEDKSEKKRILRRIEEKRIKSPVKFLGQVSEEETRKLIAGAQLYVHTSMKESFGRTLIEAINLSTPVLAVQYDAVGEILDDRAVIDSAWNEAEMAAYINFFLTDSSEKERLQKMQYKNFVEKFTMNRMVETYLETLKTKWSLA